MTATSVSVSTCELCLIDPVDNAFLVSSIPFDSHNLPFRRVFIFVIWYLQFSLCVISGCESLPLLPLAAEKISVMTTGQDTNLWTEQNIMESYWFLLLLLLFVSLFAFVSCVWLYPRSLVYPVSSFQPFKQCKGWYPSPGMGLRLNQTAFKFIALFLLSKLLLRVFHHFNQQPGKHSTVNCITNLDYFVFLLMTQNLTEWSSMASLNMLYCWGDIQSFYPSALVSGSQLSRISGTCLHS